MTEFVRKRATQMRQIGAEYGRDLAAALLLAVERDPADLAVERKMTAIVLREIGAAVQRLCDASLPELFVAIYERACRESCRVELLAAIAQRQADAGGMRTGRAAA